MRKSDVTTGILGLFLAFGCPGAQTIQYFPLSGMPVLKYETISVHQIPGAVIPAIMKTETYSNPRLVGDLLLRDVRIDSVGTWRETVDTCRFENGSASCTVQGQLTLDPPVGSFRTDYIFQGKHYLQYRELIGMGGDRGAPQIAARTHTEFYEEGTGLLEYETRTCDAANYCFSFSRVLIASDSLQAYGSQLASQVRLEGLVSTSVLRTRGRSSRGAAPAVLDLLGRQLPNPSRSMPLFPAAKTR